MKITMILLLFLQGHALFAQSQRLVVWLKSGEKIYYELEENPKTTFEGTDIVITTSNLSVNYPLKDVFRYTYELQVSGIENANKTKPVHISQKDNNLVFDNLKSGTQIQLFATDGKLLKSMAADGRQTIAISLDLYPSGVYIVKAGSVTYKMMKR